MKVDGLDESETVSDVVIEGDGPEVADDGAAKVHVLMVKGTDGSTIQSSYSGEAPQTLELSTVPSWIQDALSGVAIGSRGRAGHARRRPSTTVRARRRSELEADDDVVFVFDLVDEAEPTLTDPRARRSSRRRTRPRWSRRTARSPGSTSPTRRRTHRRSSRRSRWSRARAPPSRRVTRSPSTTSARCGARRSRSTTPTPKGSPPTFQLVYPGLIKGWVKGTGGGQGRQPR